MSSAAQVGEIYYDALTMMAQLGVIEPAVPAWNNLIGDAAPRTAPAGRRARGVA